MAEPRNPREPRIPKETAPFDADNKWTRTWIMYFESLFTLSVKEAVRQAGTVTHTGGKLTEDLPVFGNGEADIKVGTKSGNTNEVATVSGAIVTGNTVEWDADGNLIDAGVAPGGGGGGGGTVTNTGGALTADQPVFGAGSADIKVGTKTGNTNKLVSNTGTNVTGNTVKWDASGNLIDAGSAPGGSGTVTSVALTVPAEFSVAGSPVTTSGTLAVTKATQTANTVYAGPTTGSAAAPTFRAVVPADLPLASSSAFGAVKVDGTTITAASGVISAVGGGGASGAMVLLESHTASSSAELDFTTRNAPGQSGATIQSDYDDYEIRLINIVPASNNVGLNLQMSTDGGSSYGTGANYSFTYNNNWINSGNSGGLASQTAIQIGNLANASGYSLSGKAQLPNPGSVLYKSALFDISFNNAAVSSVIRTLIGGWYLNTTAVNAFRFLMSSGNIASGTIRVYGIAK